MNLERRPHPANRLPIPLVLLVAAAASAAPSPERLEQLRRKYPKADANGDGTLTLDEALAYQQKMRGGNAPAGMPAPALPEPTRADVKYGPHERNVFDFWRTPSNGPAPLVVFIHGGGFVGGDKSKANPAALQRCLESGASFVSINYRFREHAPIQDILHDCARAVQFVRLHAGDYGIDPKRIASFGGSAGAGTSVWLASRDDLADPKSDDPVLRQSSRITAAAALNPQATYDLAEWEKVVFPFRPEWYEPREKNAFYHFKDDAEFDSGRGRAVRAECSMLRWLGPGDAPLFLSCTEADGEPHSRGHLLHHPKHCLVLKERAEASGVPVELRLASSGTAGPRKDAAVEAVDFLLGRLRAAGGATVAGAARR